MMKIKANKIDEREKQRRKKWVLPEVNFKSNIFPLNDNVTSTNVA